MLLSSCVIPSRRCFVIPSRQFCRAKILAKCWNFYFILTNDLQNIFEKFLELQKFKKAFKNGWVHLCS